MQNKTTIKCPNCDYEIDVNEVLYHQLEDKLKQENKLKQKELYDKISKKQQELQEQELAIKQQKENYNKELQKAIQNQLKLERQKLKQELENEQHGYISLLKQELNEKSIKIQELNKNKAEIEKLKREKQEIESKLKAEAESILTERLEAQKQEIQKTILAQNELKLKQKDEQLRQLQQQLKIAQQKAEQGSTQLQGEVQELAIEEYLKNRFPFDLIEEVKKGVRGADCIQVVNTREMQNCGTIYYESKRTKEFQKNWVSKFKADMIDKSADIGVLVTKTLPKELNRVGLIDGVWVCTFDEFKGLSGVLRESIIKIHQAKKTQENKADKMNLLYRYLTSNEFKMQVEAIVDGFSTMQEDINKEKRAMNKIWKQREKQIEKVLENTINMYGAIKGIAGNVIGDVKSLELHSDE